MIYTVTPNPALDITWGVPGWERGSTTRVTDIEESPGPSAGRQVTGSVTSSRASRLGCRPAG